VKAGRLSEMVKACFAVVPKRHEKAALLTIWKEKGRFRLCFEVDAKEPASANLKWAGAMIGTF